MPAQLRDCGKLLERVRDQFLGMLDLDGVDFVKDRSPCNGFEALLRQAARATEIFKDVA